VILHQAMNVFLFILYDQHCTIMVFQDFVN
jgi:hypothetical protein